MFIVKRTSATQTARKAQAAVPACQRVGPRPVALRAPIGSATAKRDVRALASSKQSDSEPEDFDAWLMKNAEAWEKAEQKPAIVAWISAAVLLFVFAEWLIHLPALDILLGFPVQVLGLMTIPVIVSRYYLDKKASFQEDAGQIIESYTSKLPGLKKE